MSMFFCICILQSLVGKYNSISVLLSLGQNQSYLVFYGVFKQWSLDIMRLDKI